VPKQRLDIHQLRDPSARPKTPTVVWMLLAIVAIGVALRVFGLGSRPIWLDEASSLRNATAPLSQLWSWAHPIDVGDPPLYFAILHFWIAVFGSSVTALRSLSVLFGVALIPVVYHLGRVLFNRTAGIVSALLVAVSPPMLRFSQEARMYPLLSLEICIALLGMALLLETPDSGSPPASSHPFRDPAKVGWGLYVVGTGFALLTHHIAIFFFVAANAILILTARLRTRRWLPPTWWIAAQAGVVGLWGLWIPGFVYQLRHWNGGGFPSLTLRRALLVGRDLLVPSWKAAAGPGPDVISLIAVGIAIGLALNLLIHQRHRTWFLLLAIVPGLFWAMVLGASLVSPILVLRTVVWTVVPVVVILAAGIQTVRPLATRIVLGIVLLLTIGWSVFRYETLYQNPPWDKAAAYVASKAAPHDVLLFYIDDGSLLFQYYLPPGTDLQLVPISDQDASTFTPEPSGLGHTWLVYSHWALRDPKGDFPKRLIAMGDLVNERLFHQITIYEFTFRDDGSS